MEDKRVTLFWKSFIILLTVFGILIAINQFFYLNLFGINIMRGPFLFVMLGLFVPIIFITKPISKKHPNLKVAWYDITFFILTIVLSIYFSINGEDIINMGWEYSAPPLATVFSYLYWIIILEALRRSAGWVVTVIALLLSVFPLFTDKMPMQLLQGVPYTLENLARSHTFSTDSIMGLPLQAAGTILVGFLLFGVVLQQTGGADFFYNMAQSVFGRSRGGSAKVSIVSSAFMGMMSGSAVSNVLTTGPMTIPAMKKGNFKPYYAASVEATASTGGTITPPIMGSAAFIMVTFLGIPYSEIVIAATIPAILYFWGIFVQVDAYAAKNNLLGSQEHQLKDVLKYLKQGWPFVFALLLLIYLLVVHKLELQAPYITSLFLLLVSIFYKENRLTFKSFMNIFYESGKVIGEIIGIIAGVGLIVGGLSLTGVALSLSGEIVSLVGDNVFLILVAGAITCFILGMGMTVSAVYVFLAIVMAPSLVQMGINPIAAHLFVIYWATVSYITPPVALASFSAAGIAGSSPMKTSINSMKLGSVKYFIPFFFVYNPSMIAQGDIKDVVITLLFSIVGIFFLASGLEGYMAGIGELKSLLLKFIFVIIGITFFFPSLLSDLLALILAVLVISFLLIQKRIKVRA